MNEEQSIEIAAKIDEVVAQLKLESPECFNKTKDDFVYIKRTKNTGNLEVSKDGLNWAKVDVNVNLSEQKFNKMIRAAKNS